MDAKDDFQFRPLTKGLGFHKNKSVGDSSNPTSAHNQNSEEVQKIYTNGSKDFRILKTISKKNLFYTVLIKIVGTFLKLQKNSIFNAAICIIKLKNII